VFFYFLTPVFYKLEMIYSEAQTPILKKYEPKRAARAEKQSRMLKSDEKEKKEYVQKKQKAKDIKKTGESKFSKFIKTYVIVDDDEDENKPAPEKSKPEFEQEKIIEPDSTVSLDEDIVEVETFEELVPETVTVSSNQKIKPDSSAESKKSDVSASDVTPKQQEKTDDSNTKQKINFDSLFAKLNFSENDASKKADAAKNTEKTVFDDSEKVKDSNQPVYHKYTKTRKVSFIYYPDDKPILLIDINEEKMKLDDFNIVSENNIEIPHIEEHEEQNVEPSLELVVEKTLEAEYDVDENEEIMNFFDSKKAVNEEQTIETEVSEAVEENNNESFDVTEDEYINDGWMDYYPESDNVIFVRLKRSKRKPIFESEQRKSGDIIGLDDVNFDIFGSEKSEKTADEEFIYAVEDRKPVIRVDIKPVKQSRKPKKRNVSASVNQGVKTEEFSKHVSRIKKESVFNLEKLAKSVDRVLNNEVRINTATENLDDIIEYNGSIPETVDVDEVIKFEEDSNIEASDRNAQNDIIFDSDYQRNISEFDYESVSATMDVYESLDEGLEDTADGFAEIDTEVGLEQSYSMPENTVDELPVSEDTDDELNIEKTYSVQENTVDELPVSEDTYDELNIEKTYSVQENTVDELPVSEDTDSKLNIEKTYSVQDNTTENLPSTELSYEKSVDLDLEDFYSEYNNALNEVNNAKLESLDLPSIDESFEDNEPANQELDEEASENDESIDDEFDDEYLEFSDEDQDATDNNESVDEDYYKFSEEDDESVENDESSDDESDDDYYKFSEEDDETAENDESSDDESDDDYYKFSEEDDEITENDEPIEGAVEYIPDAVDANSFVIDYSDGKDGFEDISSGEQLDKNFDLEKYKAESVNDNAVKKPVVPVKIDSMGNKIDSSQKNTDKKSRYEKKFPNAAKAAAEEAAASERRKRRELQKANEEFEQMQKESAEKSQKKKSVNKNSSVTVASNAAANNEKKQKTGFFEGLKNKLLEATEEERQQIFEQEERERKLAEKEERRKAKEKEKEKNERLKSRDEKAQIKSSAGVSTASDIYKQNNSKASEERKKNSQKTKRIEKTKVKIPENIPADGNTIIYAAEKKSADSEYENQEKIVLESVKDKVKELENKKVTEAEKVKRITEKVDEEKRQERIEQLKNEQEQKRISKERSRKNKQLQNERLEKADQIRQKQVDQVRREHDERNKPQKKRDSSSVSLKEVENVNSKVSQKKKKRKKEIDEAF